MSKDLQQSIVMQKTRSGEKITPSIVEKSTI
jgi:hypothetical protein